jgi:hypothetical protein
MANPARLESQTWGRVGDFYPFVKRLFEFLLEPHPRRFYEA